MKRKNRTEIVDRSENIESESDGCFQVENVLMDYFLRPVGAQAIAVWLMFKRFCKGKEKAVFVNVSLNDWAQYAGMSKPTFMKSLDKLEGIGLLEIDKANRTRYRPQRYTLQDPIKVAKTFPLEDYCKPFTEDNRLADKVFGEPGMFRKGPRKKSKENLLSEQENESKKSLLSELVVKNLYHPVVKNFYHSINTVGINTVEESFLRNSTNSKFVGGCSLSRIGKSPIESDGLGEGFSKKESGHPVEGWPLQGEENREERTEAESVARLRKTIADDFSSVNPSDTKKSKKSGNKKKQPYKVPDFAEKIISYWNKKKIMVHSPTSKTYKRAADMIMKMANGTWADDKPEYSYYKGFKFQTKHFRKAIKEFAKNVDANNNPESSYTPRKKQSLEAFLYNPHFSSNKSMFIWYLENEAPLKSDIPIRDKNPEVTQALIECLEADAPHVNWSNGKKNHVIRAAAKIKDIYRGKFQGKVFDQVWRREIDVDDFASIVYEAIKRKHNQVELKHFFWHTTYDEALAEYADTKGLVLGEVNSDNLEGLGLPWLS